MNGSVHVWSPRPGVLGHGTGGGALAVLAAEFAAERERWALWIPVLFGLGIAAYFGLREEPPAWLAPAVFILAAGAALVFRRSQPVLLLAVAVVAAAAGFAAADWRTERVRAPVLEKRYGPAWVRGQVVRVENLPRGPRVWLERVVLPGVAREKTPRRIRIALIRGSRPVVGLYITVLARLTPPRRPAMPGAYDFQRRAWFDGLGAVGFALGPARQARVVATGKPVSSFSLWLARLRQEMANRILDALPGPQGAVAAALVVGDRSAIPSSVLAAMRDSGLAHLLAISGLHMGLVAATLFFVLRAVLALFEPIALRFPIKKWAAAAAMLGSFLYMGIAGTTVPTERAFLMTGLVLIAVIVDRIAISLRLVALAAMVIMVATPESLLGASFQLSFAAVVALVATYEGARAPVREWAVGRSRARRIGVYFAALALSTLVAGAATGVIAIYHFGRIVHYGLAANLVAVPVTAFWIMPWGILAVLLMPFGLEKAALAPMGWGIDSVLAVAQAVASWPGAVQTVPAMPTAGLALVVFGGLWLCLWRRSWRWSGVGLLIAGLGTIALAPRPDVLVSETGRLMAVRAGDGRLALSSLRLERSTAERWIRRDGDVRRRRWPIGGFRGPPSLACDGLGCLYRAMGHRVALVWDGRALVDDCRLASVVVSAVPVRRGCPAPSAVIDRFDLWRNGSHALYLGANGRLRVATVEGERGRRPWTGPVRPAALRAAAPAPNLATAVANAILPPPVPDLSPAAFFNSGG